MICILSQSFNEPNTEHVLRWLEHWGVPCCRLNADDVDSLHGPALELRDGELEFAMTIGGRVVRSRDVEVVWMRRWSRTDFSDGRVVEIVSGSDEKKRDWNLVAAQRHLELEYRRVSEAVFRSFYRARWLNHPNACSLNKLEVLAAAQQSGLDTPATLITSDPREVQRFAAEHGQLITKCASDLALFMVGTELWNPCTVGVPDDRPIEEGWSGGFPSVFQERLDRRYELRVFYIDGECVTTARMFHDDDVGTDDGRTVDKRSVPFLLPQSIQEKIGELMRRIGLDLGVIDVLRTRDDRWVFLEVNPNGQFGADSFCCNHRLDRRIARALVERLHEHREGTERGARFEHEFTAVGREDRRNPVAVQPHIDEGGGA